MNNDQLIDLLQKIRIKFVVIAIGLLLFVYGALNYGLVLITVDVPDDLPRIANYEELDHMYMHDHDGSDASKSGENHTNNLLPEDVKVKAKSRIFIGHEASAPKDIGRPGLHLVKRGADSIEARAGDTTTRSAFSIPWYGLAFKHITLTLDTNADKVAYLSTLPQACGVYSQKNDRVMQYDCRKNPGALTHYVTPREGGWRLETVSNLYYPDFAPSHYKGGLIGITAADSSELGSQTTGVAVIKAVSENGDISFHKQPKGVTCLRGGVCVKGDDKAATAFLREHGVAAASSLFTDTKDQTNTKFVFTTSEGDLYLGTPKSGTDVSYKKIDSPADYNPALHQTHCGVNRTTAVCIQGLSNSPSGEISSRSVSTRLVTVPFDTGEVQIVDMPDDTTIIDLDITPKGDIFAQHGNDLVRLSVNTRQTEVTQELVAKNINRMSVANHVYFIANSSVFQVDTETLSTHKRFYSQHIQPERLITTGDTVVVLGKAPSNLQSSPTYAWKLNDKPNLRPMERIIDKLPSAPNSVLFGNTDLVGNVIYAQDPPKNRDTEDIQARTDRHRNEIITNMKASGIDISDFEVVWW